MSTSADRLAEAETTFRELRNALEAGVPVYGAPGTRDVDVAAQRARIFKALTLIEGFLAGIQGARPLVDEGVKCRADGKRCSTYVECAATGCKRASTASTQEKT